MYAWVVISICLALVLMLLTFFLKSFLIFLMCAAAWIGVIVLTDNLWIQIVAGVGVAWSGIAIFRNLGAGGYD